MEETPYTMRSIAFTFDLPDQYIARYPLPERSASRLLSLDKATGQCIHYPRFSSITELLQPGDALVLNNTKVMPARLYARKQPHGGKIEILVEKIIKPHTAWVHVKSNRPIKPDTPCCIGKNTEGTLCYQDTETGRWMLQLHTKTPLLSVLANQGHMPLPPYLKRAAEPIDQVRYQTVFAKEQGAIAAPTASLHFDQTLLDTIAAAGIQLTYLTLHVGAGTFKPMRDINNIAGHTMHKEWLCVTPETCDTLNAVKQRGGRIIAVGTTVVRALETAAVSMNHLAPYSGNTQLFIYPGFQFQYTDAMITNFHLPQSTLLLLICAFAGKDAIQHAYDEAIAKQYRFFSYGDAMWIG